MALGAVTSARLRSGRQGIVAAGLLDGETFDRCLAEVTALAGSPRREAVTIQAADDPNWYPTGVKISEAELAAVPLTPHEWHGDWNHTINAHSDVA